MVERCNGREGRTEEKPQEATRIRARVQHRPLILNARDRDASRDLEIKDLLGERELRLGSGDYRDLEIAQIALKVTFPNCFF